MEKITGGTAPAILWKEFMTAAHKDIKPQAFNYSEQSTKKSNSNEKKIKELIKKSKTLEPSKNLFESILDNFF